MFLTLPGRQLRQTVSQIAGTDQPNWQAYTPKLLEKAAGEFRQLQVKRATWISEHDISKYLKGGWWRTGEFIRTEFGFTAFIKLGPTFYYDKEQLVAQNNALKERNVNPEACQRLRDDEKRFARQFVELKEQVRTGKTKKVLWFPRG